jgi:hypothetical protein
LIQKRAVIDFSPILPHPFLESRQSLRTALAAQTPILPHPFLESRQSQNRRREVAAIFFYSSPKPL